MLRKRGLFSTYCSLILRFHMIHKIYQTKVGGYPAMKASMELKGDAQVMEEMSEYGPTLKIMNGTIVKGLWRLEDLLQPF
jgi:hypothetical protein